ncbi:HTH-type transcriptional regulator NorG [Baekduia alba]|uniref:MocR-like transcription factor YczR n=1 Tax=Baekduia alba TaxID=2997333 RepID=UPI002340F257|nr:PLP-dependent aminotransferase family protein [Baekduia alba]WCB94645.1 HTH-type transcriptional regulator NorG [Baekduia alba]
MAPTMTAPSLAALLGDEWRRPGRTAQALADALRGMVVDGRLPARTRIPSERSLSDALGLSRGSVSRAFDRLRDDGYLVSARGAGSWLTLPPGAGPAAPPRLAEDGEVDLTIGALPAPDPLLADAAARATAALARHLPGLGYAPAGLGELRMAVAARLTARGLPTTADEVLITAGAQHALRLVLDLVVGPGDRVLVDAPAYPRTLMAIRAARARPVPVALAGRGWDPDGWAAAARVAAPRLAVTVPDFHHPTGRVMRAAEREAVALTCARAGAVLVVDETCAELRLDGPALPPPLGAFDPGGTVITVGSMSKAAWAGLRIGWIRATARAVRELATIRTAVDMAGPVLEQLVAVELLDSWDAVLASRRALLRLRRDALLAALAEHAPSWSVDRPHGGISAWARLPTPDATHLATAAAAAGILLSPGPAFSVDGTFERHVRLPFTLPPDTLRDAVGRLAKLARELGTETRAAPTPVARDAALSAV